MATSRLKSVLLAAVVAATFGSAPLPAQAQSFFFQFGFGTEDSFTHRRIRPCFMSDSQIREAVRRRGYHHIYLNVENNKRIQVRATKGDWVYLLVVSTCTGRILDRERLRPA